MTVKATTERNFRRAQVKPGRRRGARKLVSWRLVRHAGAGAIALYALYRGGMLVVNAPGLQVNAINVQGNVRLSSGEVRALVDDIRGTSILTANLGAYRKRLLDSPWVADAALRRVLPSTVEVFVSERRPIGLCRLGGQLYLIDRAGVIDEFGPQYAEFDLPIIDGLVRKQPSGEPDIDQQRAELAARVLDDVAGHKELVRRVSQIDVTDLHDAVVLLDSDPALLHLGQEKFAQRLQSYLDLAAALHDRVPDIDYVDLRFESRLYVRPGGGRRGDPARTSRQQF